MKSVTIIVAALLPAMGIGLKGTLPWKLRKEMKYFKQVTSLAKPNHQNAVIMGRKTWDSIPVKFKPLPDRINVVVTRSTSIAKDSQNGVIYANSIDDALTKLNNLSIDKIFIIGGSQIYNDSLKHPQVNRVLLTEITSLQKIEMDTFFNIKLSEWVKKSRGELKSFVGESVDIDDVEEGEFKYGYTMWER